VYLNEMIQIVDHYFILNHWLLVNDGLN